MWDTGKYSRIILKGSGMVCGYGNRKIQKEQKCLPGGKIHNTGLVEIPIERP